MPGSGEGIDNISRIARRSTRLLHCLRKMTVAQIAMAAGLSGLSGQPLQPEVVLAFKGLDFGVAGQEDRVELYGCRDGERVSIGARVLGPQFGRAPHSPTRRAETRCALSPCHHRPAP
jgi:hypothetical protein